MGKFTSFVIGGLVGACAALAFAPRTGQETRAAIADQVGVCKDSIMGVSGQDPQQMYQEVVESATAFAQDAVDQVTGKVQEIKTGTKPEDDELRAKIEAARQRIAEQLVVNVEESRAAIEENEAAESVSVEETAEVAEETEAAKEAE